MQQTPTNWTAGDVQRFNSLLDVVAAYQALDYARTRVAPSNAFLQARQTDVGNLALALGQQFQQMFGQD
jgi:hypothetical protein